jgi:ribosomal protein S18 acetylase RimI-like enzyme
MSVDDLLLAWAKQPEARFFRQGQAVAVAVPALMGRDRLVLTGPPADLATLLPEVYADVGTHFRPLGDATTLATLARHVAGLRLVDQVLWMHTRTRPPASATTATWLDDCHREVSRFLDAAWPSSRARPGGLGVRRWAGVRDRTGRLTAVAADAWSAPELGFLAGLSTHPSDRGRGHGRAVCTFVLSELLDAHGAAALIVNRSYFPAIRMLRGLGMTSHLLATARLLQH